MIEFDWTISIPVLISIGTLFFAWHRTRRQNVDDRFKAIDDQIKAKGERVDRLERRLQTSEERLSAVPGSEDLHRIELKIAEMNGMMGRMEAVMEGNAKIMGRLETVVSRQEDYLLAKDK